MEQLYTRIKTSRVYRKNGSDPRANASYRLGLEWIETLQPNESLDDVKLFTKQ